MTILKPALSTACAILAFAAGVRPVLAQDVTLDSVLALHVKAIGGAPATIAVRTRISHGVIEFAGEASGKYEATISAPDRQLIVITHPLVGTIRRGYDGTTAWQEEQGVVGDQTTFARREADVHFFTRMREHYPGLRLLGRERIGQRETWVVEAPRGGRPRRWYFATDNGLVIRTEVIAAGQVVFREDYDDFRPVDGVLLPFTVRQLAGALEWTIRISGTKHNAPVDSAIFARPARAPDGESELATLVRAGTIEDVTVRLSSREMEGRGPGQRGGHRAEQFLIQRFTSLGLSPGSGASFCQNVPIVVRTLDSNASLMVGSARFTLARDFGLAQTSEGTELQGVHGSVVFVGYGVTSAELGRDDLKGLDLRGRIALVIQGESPRDVDLAQWSRASDEKVVVRRLVDRGAAAILIWNADPEARTRFPELAAYVSHRFVTLLDPPEPAMRLARWSVELLADERPLPPVAMISDAVIEEIFRQAGRTFRDIHWRTRDGGAVATPLDVPVRLSIEHTRENARTCNVIGIVPGADPRLRDEAIIYVAHHDAYGTGPRGTTYPGAIDNALGVAKLVATAEAFMRAPSRPDRTIVFLATAAEEYGNLGSEHWSRHPTWPIERVRGVIAFDGPPSEVWGELAFLIDYGLGQGALGREIRAAAARQGVIIVPDPLANEQIMRRGDQALFAKHSIPAALIWGGPASDPTALLDRAQKWARTVYHMPNDTVSVDWNWNGPRKAAAIAFVAGNRLATK